MIAVLHGHSDVQGPQRLPGVKRFLLRHGADRVVFVSDALKENLQPLLRLRDNQCIVIPNGVDIERFQPRREPDDGAPRPSVVGAQGSRGRAADGKQVRAAGNATRKAVGSAV